MRKKLIVSGCSFTTNNFRSSAYPLQTFNFKKWPELLAEKLDMDLVNLAFSGAGNRFILSTLTDAIVRTPKDEIGLVIAAWSQSNRDDFQQYKDIDHMFYNEKFIKGFKWLNDRKNRPGDVFSWTRETVLGYLQFQSLCERYNVPYKQFQMIPLFGGWLSGLVETEDEIKMRLEQEHGRKLSKEEIESLSDHRYNELISEHRSPYKGDYKRDKDLLCKLVCDYGGYINDKNFIGWPGLHWMGGHTIEEKCIMRDVKRKDGRHDYYEVMKDRVIGFLDKHPNEDGHIKIMRFIHEQLG